MQLPILKGIYATTAPDLRTALPVNWKPVPKDSGVSQGYLRPADGIVPLGSGPGTDRGGYNWNGTCYRVMGSKLVRVALDGSATELGSVGTDGNPVRFDCSFDYLAVASAGNLYLFDGSTITQVTDTDLGTVVDLAFIDGYFLTIDGEYIVAPDLTDPTSVNPLHYGSSEVDPDPIKAIFNVNDEAVAVNRYTIETFRNVGGSGFPFARVSGALITKGAIGTHACCKYLDAIAFLGGGRNEPVAVHIGINGTMKKLSTHEVDTILEGFTEAQLATAQLEARNDKGHVFLYVHLPDRTLVYDAAASEVIGEPVWFVQVSGVSGYSKWRARNMVRAYDKWIVGDPSSTSFGYLTDTISSHWGDEARWELTTAIVYNEAAGAIFNELELVALTGSAAFGDNPAISTSYSLDGVEWSSDRTINLGRTGDRDKRLVWFGQGFMRKWRVQRFRGTSDAHMSIVRLEAALEPLAY